MACKVSQWLRLPQDMQSSPSQPEERGSLKRVKFNSNMPQCTAGWRRELVPRRGGVVGLWGVLWNSNWNLPLAIGSVVKCAAQRIKSQLKAKLLPVCQLLLQLRSVWSLSLCASVRESIYAPPSQLELELECMRVLASAFSRINSESCAKRTRQDTKETDTETVRNKEMVKEGGERKGTAQTDCASHVRDLLNVLNFQMTLRAAGS